MGVIQKQDADLSTPEGFLEWVLTLALDLRLADRVAIEGQMGILRQYLNQNWPGLSQAEIDGALGDITNLISLIRQTALGWQEPMLEFAAHEVSETAKANWTARYGLGVVPVFTVRDRMAEQFLVNSTMNFMRARDGRINDEFSRRAREVVAQGLSRGLGRRDIASSLQQVFLTTQSPAYYNLIAGQYVNRARSWGALRSMQEAGLELAEIVAVLDERTTDTCRFLDGKYIVIGNAMELLTRMEESDSPESVREMNPWVKEGKDDEGRYLFVGEGDNQIEIARVVRSGVGTKDDQGEYSNALRSPELQTLGIGPPPYHAYCRSSLVPVVEEVGTP